MIPLSKQQREIITEFYNLKKEKVFLSKKQRDELWNKTKNRKQIDFDILKQKCPALEHQIQKSYQDGNNIQQAVFSECIYAQALANVFNLIQFHNCLIDNSYIPTKITELLHSYNLVSRYMYCNTNKTRMLIQAGSCDGIDSALIWVEDLTIYTIEFKERGAKTGEHDILPLYGEDGKIKIAESFIRQYPQFKLMLEEQKDLNFFDNIGNNINNFSVEAVKYSVSNSYVKKYADVICSEDIDGYLIMFPSNQIEEFANLQGEIRPAGRNHCKVFTPNKLKQFLLEKQATIENEIVKIDKNNLIPAIARGGNGEINRYKINSLFFVYAENCEIENDKIVFNIKDVRQLKPTIASKMFLRDKIKYDDFKEMFIMF